MSNFADGSQFVVVEESSDLNLLDVKRSYLESNGIECSVVGENFLLMEGVRRGGFLRARLTVRADQAEEAVRLLAEKE